jgi:hypothetical protein
MKIYSDFGYIVPPNTTSKIVIKRAFSVIFLLETNTKISGLNDR